MKLGLFLLAGVLVLLLALRGLSRSMIFPGSPVPLPESDQLHRAFPAARAVDYTSVDGHALRGVFFHDSAKKRTVVVDFHGNGESAAHNIPFGAELFSKGYDVFLAEYRGYAGLGGSPSEEGLYQDAQGVLSWLKSQGIEEQRLILYGRSLGTGVAVELAKGRSVNQVVLVSPYTSMVDMGRLLAGPLAPLVVRDRFDSISKLPQIRCPVVIIHGRQDEVIPVQMGRALAAARPGTRYIELPDASHNDIPGLVEILAGELRRVEGDGS